MTVTFTPIYRGTPDNPQPVPIGIGEVDLGYGNKILVTDEDQHLPTQSDYKLYGYSSNKHLPLRLKDAPELGLDLLFYILDQLGVTNVYDPYTASIDPDGYSDNMKLEIWKEELRYVLDFNRTVGSDSTNFVTHRFLYK